MLNDPGLGSVIFDTSQQLGWNDAVLDRLIGTHRLKTMILNDAYPDEIFASWEKELAEFKKTIRMYFLY